MPEYLALIHHHTLTTAGEGEGPAPTADEVEAQFLAMERLGIARIH